MKAARDGCETSGKIKPDMNMNCRGDCVCARADTEVRPYSMSASARVRSQTLLANETGVAAVAFRHSDFRTIIKISSNGEERCGLSGRSIPPSGLSVTCNFVTVTIMDLKALEQLLAAYKSGEIETSEAARRIGSLHYEDIGYARVDHSRSTRQGFPEVVFGAGKTREQVVGIVERLVQTFAECSGHAHRRRNVWRGAKHCY